MSSRSSLPHGRLLSSYLWAVLHGMAALYLDRSTAFDLKSAQDCVAKFLLGTRVQAHRRP
jgi:hypothetical protein